MLQTLAEESTRVWHVPQDFLLAAAGGSKATSQAAGHMQFATLCTAKQVLADASCGYDGSVSAKVGLRTQRFDV